MKNIALAAMLAISLALSPSGSRATPLHVATHAGDIAKARALIMDDPSSVNVMDPQGRTPLSIAAQEGRLELAKLLIEKGAALDARANDRRASHATAAFYADPATVARLRVKAPVDDVGATPLHIAAKEGRVDVVKLLLDSGAPVDAKDSDGLTPLASAIDNPDVPLETRLAVVDALLGKGARAASLRVERLGDRAKARDMARAHGLAHVAALLGKAPSKRN